jgi:23S rRNA G2445 N2-methylase RlmL
MADIDKYYPDNDSAVHDAYMTKAPWGDYVRYEDHKRIVEELQKELAQASERYVQLWTRSNYR